MYIYLFNKNRRSTSRACEYVDKSVERKERQPIHMWTDCV